MSRAAAGTACGRVSASTNCSRLDQELPDPPQDDARAPYVLFDTRMTLREPAGGFRAQLR